MSSEEDLLCDLLQSLPVSSTDSANQHLKVLGFKCQLVDDEAKLVAMADEILSKSEKVESFALNVDFEGVRLCRSGRICLEQFHISGSNVVHLVDFVSMNPFTGAEGKLKQILESKLIKKVLFDPRNDADALTAQYDVYMNNVLCLQVAEVAYRKFVRRIPARYVRGLQKTMEEYINNLRLDQKSRLIEIKAHGKQMFQPELGESYEVFVKRPMPDKLLAYCAVDVFYMDHLKRKIYEPLREREKEKVHVVSEKRLLEHQQEGYLPSGPEKSHSPYFH